MRSLNQAQMKRLTAVHGWSGFILGLLLYAVIITGTVVVMAHEISEWSKGGGDHRDLLATGIDAQIRPALDILPKGYLDEVSIYGALNGNLSVFAHTHVKHPESDEFTEFGTLFLFDGDTGERLLRKDIFRDELNEHVKRNALRDFLVDLHIQLYVPKPWGLILTGILGLAMMAAGTTGMIIHRHLIKDMFVPERPGKRLVSARDRHNLAGTWSLPFTFILGLTGAFFSFAISIGLPILTMIAFGGDQLKMAETFVGQRAYGEERPAETVNLDQIIARATEQAGNTPTFMNISNYGQGNTVITTYHDARTGDLFSLILQYAGVDGHFLGEKPTLGTKPSVGGTFIDLMRVLHFGSFAGLLSKIAWVALGVATCFVTYTGMELWIRKREQDPLWQKFARAHVVVGFGLPIAMLGSALTFFIAQLGLDEEWWTGAGFVLFSILCILIGLKITDTQKLKRLFLQMIGSLCLCLPILRMVTGGPGTFEALGAGYDIEVTMLDTLFVFLGAAVLLWISRAKLARLRPVAEPAE